MIRFTGAGCRLTSVGTAMILSRAARLGVSDEVDNLDHVPPREILFTDPFQVLEGC